MIRHLFASLLLLLLAGAAHGQGLSLSFGPAGDPVTARAAISQNPIDAGTPAQIVVEVSIKPPYHVQSAFAQVPFIAAKVTASAPEGIVLGPVEAQKGMDIATPPALGKGTLSVYEGKAYFRIPVSATAQAAAAEQTIDLALITQACDDQKCLPPRTIRMQVKVSTNRAPAEPFRADAALFEAAAKQEFAPQPMPAPVATATTPATGASTAADPASAANLLTTEQQLAAIAQRPYRAANRAEETYGVPVLLLFALLGGLILNVMPCVLPVIPLKAVSFVQQAHGDRQLAMVHGLAFAGGIVTLFVLLALVLRGLGLFYGQQFQSPAFLITMALFVVALSLSMLGVWTINPPQAVYAIDAKLAPREPRHALLGSFSSGLMATLLATPCSAPFLGPVFAWALVQPAWLTAVALAFVGIGMSLPYLLLAAFPALLASVPRAGRWSELLKQGLGIVMLGVAIYLITRIPSTRAWTWALLGALIVALVCWAWGQIPSPLYSARRTWTIRGIALAVGVLLGTGTWQFAARAGRADTAQWQPFNLALLDQGLKEGRPVVIDWTADWCINCQALDAAVLSRQETRQAFDAANALLLRADLSRENAEATALNEKLGGQAIPVLAIFAPSRPHEPVVLRDSYTVARVVKEVQNAR